MSALSGPFDGLVRQLRANPRLRVAVALIGLLVGVYALLALVDLRAHVAADYAERVADMRSLRALAGQPEWLDRAQAASRLRKGLEAQIGQVATVGIAEAEVQAWARDRAAAVGGQAQVSAQAPAEVEGTAGLWRVPVVVSGTADPAQVVQLMHAIDSSARLAVVEQASVLNRENRTFSLTVAFYYRIQGASDVAP
ncbi:hypothetical protein [Lysobacter xanthus]